MKITTNWLKEHLETKLNENEIIDKLTDIGLEVESVVKQSGEFDAFIVAKILKAEKHPDADRLKVCDVDIGLGNPVKVVCGAPNAKKGLLNVLFSKIKFLIPNVYIAAISLVYDFSILLIVNPLIVVLSA